QLQISLVDVHARQTSEHEHPHPFRAIDGLEVARIKGDQAVGKSDIAARQHGVPIGFPAAQINSFVDSVDECILGIEVAKQKSVRYAEAACELPHASGETDL